MTQIDNVKIDKIPRPTLWTLVPRLATNASSSTTLSCINVYVVPGSSPKGGCGKMMKIVQVMQCYYSFAYNVLKDAF